MAESSASLMAQASESFVKNWNRGTVSLKYPYKLLCLVLNCPAVKDIMRKYRYLYDSNPFLEEPHFICQLTYC